MDGEYEVSSAVRTGALRETAIACWKIFDQCSQTTYLDAAPQKTLVNQHSRFKVWCGNLGVLQNGHASLDWRLQYASIVGRQVFELLGDLKDDLQQCFEVMSGKRPPVDDDPSRGDDDHFESESEDGGTEIDIRCDAVSVTIKNLYRVAFLIRNQGSRQLAHERAQTYEPRDDTGDDLLQYHRPYDRKHIDDLLKELRRLYHPSSEQEMPLTESEHRIDRRKQGPETDDILRERLTAATTARRRQFAYWEMHSRKMKASLPEESAANDGAETKEGQGDLPVREVTIYSDTEASAIAQPTAEFKPTFDTQSEGSGVSTIRDIYNEEAQLPGPPQRDAEDDAFVCPFCHVLCPASDAKGRRWRKHILEDFQPYVCTYPDCVTGNRLYGKRSEWLAHEGLVHRTAWKCRNHPGRVFVDETEFTKHLRDEDKEFDESQVKEFVALAMCAREDDREQCPVCLIDVADLPKMHTLPQHLANHLERFSLDAQPASSYDDDDFSARSGSQSGSEIDSEAEHKELDVASRDKPVDANPDAPVWEYDELYDMGRPTRTYMLLPDFDFRRREDLELGTILAQNQQTKMPDPLKPILRTTTSADLHASTWTEQPFSFATHKSRSMSAGVKIPGTSLRFGTPELNRGSGLTIECESLETVQFTPDSTFLAKVLENPEVKTALSSRFLSRPVYLVTGLKIAHGLKFSSTKYEGLGSDVDKSSLQAGLGLPVSIGPRVDSRKQDVHEVMAAKVILAYRVQALKLKRSGRLDVQDYTKFALL